MKSWRKNGLLIFLTMFIGCLNTLTVVSATEQGVRIVWKEGKVKGQIEVQNAVLSSTFVYEAARDTRKAVKGSAFQISNAAKQSLLINFSDAGIAPGPEPALVTIRTANHAFSFFLRDVTSGSPIYIPSYGVAVVPATDLRSYRQVEENVLSRGLLTKAEQTNLLPEASWEQVAPNTRNMSAPISLGLGRDMRMFEITEELQDVVDGMYKVIRPNNSLETGYSTYSYGIPETGNRRLSYSYALGRGVGPLNNIRRWIEDGTLPIYHSETRDDDVVYHSIAFAALENEPLREGNVEGTDYLISDAYSRSRMFTPEALKELEEKMQTKGTPTEEVILYIHTKIVNTGKAMRYAWLQTPSPFYGYAYYPETGFAGFSPERIFCVSQLDGLPVPAEQMAVLIPPGDTVVLDFRLPHSPIDSKRAMALRDKSFDEYYAAARSYWQGKLDRAAKIKIPEKRIDEMLRAGLLHLDLVTMGIEPDEPLAPKIGTYPPIATESTPILQFYLSMGLDDIVRRSLDYFFATQQSDGRIMNVSYTIETGAALWSVGEYFRYTHDAQWIHKMKPELLKACEYLINWRKMDESGIGMIAGKVADPEDDFHQFMLNSYACMGMVRLAEIMRELGEPETQRLTAEANSWREATRKAALDAMAKSPVVPLGDGTWCPTVPPWPEAPGPKLLFQKAENFRSHGTFVVADDMLGPVYLVFCEVFGPDDPISQNIMAYSSELMHQGHSGFSQPYYCRLNWWQALTGKVKPFLDAYYTTMSAHADRETYTFWEHFFRVTSHKTHEEAGFLMYTRWMLYNERGDTLNVFPVIPRAWMEEGKGIRLDGVKSYFGALNVSTTGLKNGAIEATIECLGDRKPRNVMVRLPHPEGKKPVAVSVGKYIPEKESILIENFTGEAKLRLEF